MISELKFACATAIEVALTRRLLLLAAAFFGANASAQDVSMPNCASNPPIPSHVVTVPGFPAERLYFHPIHPGLCGRAEDIRCKPNAYVISGDRITVSESCANWSFSEFDGKKKVSGWVASGHLPRIDLPEGAMVKPQLAESVPKSARSACLDAETLMNQALMDGHGGLPSALGAAQPLAELPAGVGPGGQVWGTSVSDVQIHDHILKAVAYGSGGTCHDDSMELWTPDFKTRVNVVGSNVDGAEDGGYSSETLVRLSGQLYFAHTTRSGSVTLIGFDRDLVSKAICQITALPTQHELTKTSTDPTVCDAVLDNHIEGAPIDDIEPFNLSPEAFQLGGDKLERFNYMRGSQVVSRGRLDLQNNGSIEDVAMLHFQNGVNTAGCGHDVDTTIPIVLNSDGMPYAKSEFNRKAFEDAGAGEDTRLFRFRGATYYETRSHMDSDGDITHNVWKFTASGRIKVCEFIPIQYRAIDAQ